MFITKYTRATRMITLAGLLGSTASCSSGQNSGARETLVSAEQTATGKGISNANLQLKVLTNSCGANQAQQFFQVINTGATPVKLSDIKIKFWVDDTSGQAVIPHTWNGGCVTGVNQNPSCVHPVQGVSPEATSFSPACGPDATHQANWEITVSNTDGTMLPAGASWDNIQSALNLANYSNFNPGTDHWYSPCVPGYNYTSDNHFAVYYQDALVFSSGINAPSCRAPRGTQELTGYVPTILSNTPLVGRVPASTVLGIQVGLPVTDSAGLASFIQQVSDPKNSQFRKYKTFEQFQAAHSPTAEQYQQLTSWAQSQGLTVVNSFPSRMLLGLSGTAEAIERALYVNLNYYLRPDGTQFYAPDREPSLDLSVPVLRVSDLDNFFMAKPASLTPNGTGLKDTYLAKDIRNAYAKCTTLTGTGQRLGIFLNSPEILTYFGYDTAALDRDVKTYISTSGISSSTPITACNVANGNGGCNPVLPATNLAQSVDTFYGELALDVEMAIAMAPGLDEIVIFEGDSLISALQTLATRTPVVNQFSISFDIRIMHDANAQQALALLASLGQSVFVSSGDNGPGQVDNPFATDKMLQLYYTAVGGTELQLDDTRTSYKVETTWWTPSESPGKPGTGGGTILYQAFPDYQNGLPMQALKGSLANRNFPDVSLLARKVVLIAGVLDMANPTNYYYAAGGTSAAAPLWAAFTALANQASTTSSLGTIGFANPTLYAIGKSSSYDKLFHDINDGSTTGDSTNYAILAATEGYDLATGWGTPQCDLVNRFNANFDKLPTLSVGASGSVTRGPLVCINGQGFTPGGTVTLQYTGLPQVSGGTKVITTTQLLDSTGSFSMKDNERAFVAQSVAAGISSCTSDVIANGAVGVNAIDNATGVATSIAMPAKYWCAINQTTPLGAGCFEAPVSIQYKQYGACGYVPTNLGNAATGPYSAYVAFEVSQINNSSTQTFKFDSTKLYVQQGATLDYASPNMKIYSQIFGPFAIESATYAPGDIINFGPTADLAVVVSTSNSDGAAEANETSYSLNYDEKSTDPPVNLIKSNPSQTSWDYTPNCCDIGPAVCM